MAQTTGQELDILDRALLEAQRSRHEEGEKYTALLDQLHDLKERAESQRQKLAKIDNAIRDIEHKRFERDYPDGF